jgi:tetratricopeptide (TPR) repeat protein
MGIMLLTKLDTACVFYFERYLKKNKSDILIKDAWQKMAFAWYIAGDMNKANYCRKQAGTQGTARMDADKQAEKFSESNVWPLKKLLQARLLSDGGYYSQALIILNSIDNANLTSPADKAEYYFRLGRVYEETGNSNKGLQFYQSTINAGKEGHEQFAARAALQKGRIYEQSGNNAMAIASYKECLDMPSHDFQNSIDHQAKAGLNRLEGK